jgi:hypothetical protein
MFFPILGILWRICPMLDNVSVNIFPKHTPSRIEGHPLLGNGPINTYSWEQKTVFSVGSVPWSYKRAQPVLVQIRIEEVQRSTTECSWKSEQFQWSAQSEEDDSVSDSDLWTVVISCIKVQRMISSTLKLVLLVAQTPWQYKELLINPVIFMVFLQLLLIFLFLLVRQQPRIGTSRLFRSAIHSEAMQPLATW